MNKKADISIQILIVAVIAIIVMVVIIFIFTGKAKFFTQTTSSCSQVGICATKDGCDNPDYPIEVMTEDKNCKYTKEGEELDDKEDKLRLCCQKMG